MRVKLMHLLYLNMTTDNGNYGHILIIEKRFQAIHSRSSSMWWCGSPFRCCRKPQSHPVAAGNDRTTDGSRILFLDLAKTFDRSFPYQVFDTCRRLRRC